MIDLDIGKLILLALIALVVLGPEKLPVAARTAGAIVRRLRDGWSSVRAEVERELQVAEIKQAARDASGRVAAAQAGLDAVVSDLRGHSDPLALMKPESSMADPAVPEPGRATGRSPELPAPASGASTSPRCPDPSRDVPHGRG